MCNSLPEQEMIDVCVSGILNVVNGPSDVLFPQRALPWWTKWFGRSAKLTPRRQFRWEVSASTHKATRMFERWVSRVFLSDLPFFFSLFALLIGVDYSQQTKTCDFTCSASEFMSTTDSIHVFPYMNSPDSKEQIWCVNTCSLWNHEFFKWWHVPVKPYQFWPSTTRTVKIVQNSWQQAEHVYSREIMNIQENTYWWSGTNYEQLWHVPTGSEMIPCLLGSCVFNEV